MMQLAYVIRESLLHIMDALLLVKLFTALVITLACKILFIAKKCIYDQHDTSHFRLEFGIAFREQHVSSTKTELATAQYEQTINFPSQ